jgi:predicted phosphodiesterase
VGVDIAFFSDTHNKHKQIKLPACDIAICAGDFTSLGYKHEVQAFLHWYSKQIQCLFKLFIVGNHDRAFDPKFNGELYSDKWLVDELALYLNLIYLENTSATILGLKIWGSPYTSNFHPDLWAFNKARGVEINEVWKLIPLDTDIVVTHGPAAYILDYVEQNQMYAGDEGLRYKIEEIKPKIHVFGHIHLESAKLEHKIDNYKDTMYINASVVNNAYNVIAEPVLIKLEV